MRYLAKLADKVNTLYAETRGLELPTGPVAIDHDIIVLARQLRSRDVRKVTTAQSLALRNTWLTLENLLTHGI